MKPSEGRARVVIEAIEPIIDGGRFSAKRTVGDTVQIRAAIYGDGHDHIASRVLYRHENEPKLHSVKMIPLGNDIWSGEFKVDAIGNWIFQVEGWVDHFDTWSSDLSKRIAAQAPDVSIDQQTPHSNELQLESGGLTDDKKDIRLAFLTGAELLYRLAVNSPEPDATKLKDFANSLRSIPERSTTNHSHPVNDSIKAIVDRHPDLRFSTRSGEFRIRVDRTRARFSAWYEFFPRSTGVLGRHGTLQQASQMIPRLASFGFDVIYLPPIHPIGNAFRKGKNNSVTAEALDVGSPWAIGSSHGGHTSIAPELGGFTDFDEMLRVARDSGVEIALDIAFQCSPDHPWVKSHPDWFSIRPDGSIQYAENPPKKYQDIFPLNFESDDWRNLWAELSNVFLFWAKRGVRIFRVDNPHTKALPFWEWCIDKVQQRFPDTIFLSEAFTRPHVMYGLAKGGFTQSYTYFTWRNTKEELATYMAEITSAPIKDFFRPNLWPNTPDILPLLLQTGVRAAFMQRAILAATLGANYGIYGPAFELMDHVPIREGSEEYRDSEKYQLRFWEYSREDSLLPLLGLLNKTRNLHPALQQNDTLRFHDIGNSQLLCYSKRAEEDVVLVVVNLDLTNAQSGWTDLKMGELGLEPDAHFELHDILSGETYSWQGPHNYVLLDPGKMPAHILHLQTRKFKSEVRV